MRLLAAGWLLCGAATAHAGVLDGPWSMAVRVDCMALDPALPRGDLDARLTAVAIGWSAARGGATRTGMRAPRAAWGGSWEADRVIFRGFGLGIRISAVLPPDLVATATSAGDLGESGHEDWRIATAAAGVLAGVQGEVRRGRLCARLAVFAGPARGAWSARVHRTFADPLNDMTDDVSRQFSAAGNGLMTEAEVELGWALQRRLTAFVSAGLRRTRFKTLFHSASADRDGDGTDEIVRGEPVSAPDGTRLRLDLGGTRLAAGLRIALGRTSR